MSFFCPHFDYEKDFCNRLKDACVPGRPGCILGQRAVFALPAEKRKNPKPAKKKEGS